MSSSDLDQIRFVSNESPGHVVCAVGVHLRALSRVLREMYGDADVSDTPLPLPASAETITAVCRYCEYRAVHRDEAPYHGRDVDEQVMLYPVAAKLSTLFTNEHDKAFMLGTDGILEGGIEGGLERLVACLHLSNFLNITWLRGLCVAAAAALLKAPCTVDTLREAFALPPATETDLVGYGAQHSWVDERYDVMRIAARETARVEGEKGEEEGEQAS